MLLLLVNYLTAAHDDFQIRRRCSIIADLTDQCSLPARRGAAVRKPILSTSSNSPLAPSEQSFAALRHPAFRAYFFTSALAMMADNIEHVISYWMMWEKFHSQSLGGFAVISHW